MSKKTTKKKKKKATKKVAKKTTKKAVKKKAAKKVAKKASKKKASPMPRKKKAVATEEIVHTPTGKVVTVKEAADDVGVTLTDSADSFDNSLEGIDDDEDDFN